MCTSITVNLRSCDTAREVSTVCGSVYLFVSRVVQHSLLPAFCLTFITLSTTAPKSSLRQRARALLEYRFLEYWSF